MAKRNKNAKVGYGPDVNDPQDAIHMGDGKRIRLEDVPIEDANGDNQVGNRAYNDARYQFKGQATNNQQAAFLYGGYLIYSGVDLKFNTAPTAYILPGIDTPIVVASVPIDLNDYPGLNNGTDPQFVKPQWDVNGLASVIFGPASVNPIEPTVNDPLTQIAGTSLLLNAGATSIDPGTIQTRVIFAEGAVGEASMTHEGSGSANFADSESPIEGTICANVSNVQNNSREVANFGEDINPTTFDVIAVRVQLKAVMASGYNLAIQFLDNANAPVSGLVNLPINKNELGIQLLSLSISDFTFSAGLARKATLHWRRGAGSVTFTGYRFDDWILQGGIAAPIVQGDVVLRGQVNGTGKTGTPINVVVTEKAISEQTEQTDPVPGNAQHMIRLANGSLRKVADSLIASGKVDKVTGKSLIDDTEIARLAGINDRFKGKYTSLANLQAAHPTANAGDYAQVDTGAANPVQNYNYDVEDGWVIGSTGGAVISNTDELPEGTGNLYFTGSRVLATIITGVSFVTNRAILATDSILVALGLLQKQITDAIASISGKQDTLVSGTNIKTVNGNSLLGTGNIDLDPDYLASTGNILFDVKRKYGFTTAVTGNLTCGITDAREDVVAKVRHNHTTEPTVSGPGGVTVVKDGGTYVPSTDNTLYLVAHKNDAGTVFKITYTIAK
jgi:hypothetical protein